MLKINFYMYEYANENAISDSNGKCGCSATYTTSEK